MKRFTLALVLPLLTACSAPLPLAPSSAPALTITVRILEYATNRPIRDYVQSVAAGVESCISVSEPGYRTFRGFGTVCGTVNANGETWSFWVERE